HFVSKVDRYYASRRGFGASAVRAVLQTFQTMADSLCSVEGQEFPNRARPIWLAPANRGASNDRHDRRANDDDMGQGTARADGYRLADAARGGGGGGVGAGWPLR